MRLRAERSAPHETLHLGGVTSALDLDGREGGCDVLQIDLGQFDVGGGNPWNWVSPTMSETVTKFAPTTTVGAALILGKVFTVGADYVSIKLVDSKKTQARLGAELAVVPGFLFARGGVKRDLKNKLDNQDNKVDEYFIGAGLKMLVLTVDASASLASAKAGSSGDNMTAGVSATLKF